MSEEVFGDWFSLLDGVEALLYHISPAAAVGVVEFANGFALGSFQARKIRPFGQEGRGK